MKRLSLLATFLFLMASLRAQAPYWKTFAGSYGGQVDVMTTNSNLAYARYNLTNNLYYRSVDYGEHWEPFSITKPDPSVDYPTYFIGYSGNFYTYSSALVNGNFVSTLFRSLDEGATWELRNNQTLISNIQEAPSGTLIGYNQNGVLYRSVDQAQNWVQVFNLSTLLTQSNVKITFGNDGKMLLSVTSGQTIYSLDDGQTWNVAGNSGGAGGTIAMSQSGTLFRIVPMLHLEDQLVYRSGDWGLNWTTSDIHPENLENAQSIVELPGGRLLMAASYYVYYSDDDGLSWDVLPTTFEKARFFFTNGALANGDLLGRMNGANYRSSDNGATWTFSSYGIQMADVKQMALISDSLHLAVTDNGLWRTTDAGNTWNRLLPEAYLFPVDNYHPIAAVNADSFAVALGINAWRTTDGGQHFTDITPPDKVFYGNLFTDGAARLFGTDPSGIIRSLDFGQSWQSVFANRKLVSLEFHPDGGLVALASPLSSNATQLFRSQDNGVTWEEAPPIPGLTPTAVFYSIQMSSQGDLFVLIRDGSVNKLARSYDLGNNWVVMPIPITTAAKSPLAINGLDHLFVVGSSIPCPVFSSADQGQSWFSLPAQTGYNDYASGLEVSPSGYLYYTRLSGPVHRSLQSTHNGSYVRGQALRDTDADCSTADAQNPLKNWVLEASGEQSYVVTTSEEGRYTLFVQPDTYEIELQVPQQLWWSVCDSVQTAQVDANQVVNNLDFVAIAASECPLISVDVAMPGLRRCFSNTVYLKYCNAGSELADSTWIDVQLDPFLEMEGSEQPFVPLGDNNYRFFTGPLEWGGCQDFSFSVLVSCDAVLGQTHCITAHGFPDSLCIPVPMWSGANIEARATCQNGSVQLKLHNTAPVPSETLDYIIIEDDVVLLHGQKQYDMNETITMQFPANGHTWRIESEQEPGHPFSNLALAFLEGCGGYESLGYINQFSVNGWAPSINQECVENSGSYDPNDKRGFPLGYGGDHRIRPGQALEYMIRFQNTGTDTAFTVQIRDTLSPWLNPATVRPGASSHAYTWSLSGAGVLTFQFDNVMLPDSTTNLAGSQGFVSFRINQRPEVPLETQILNSAAIYFDFNEPVITNQTLHTVGIDYITAVHDAGSSNTPSISIQPNPALHETLLALPEGTERLTLFNTLGQPLHTWRASGATFLLDRRGLPSGVYAVRAEDGKGKVTGVGMVMWK